MKFLMTWYPALIVLAIGAAFFAYGWKKEHEGKKEAKTEAKIERLETENDNLNRDIQTRKKQDEITARDITPSALDDILQKHKF